MFVRSQTVQFTTAFATKDTKNAKMTDVRWPPSAASRRTNGHQQAAGKQMPLVDARSWGAMAARIAGRHRTSVVFFVFFVAKNVIPRRLPLSTLNTDLVERPLV